MSAGLRVGALAWIVALAATAIALEQPRRVVPASALSSEFSAERAMQQVRQIARAPHPTGSAEHDRVREYLVAQLRALGLEPSIQKTTSVQAVYGTAATVENILAQREGSAHAAGDVQRPALLLAAHYDSVPAGPGAGDDAAGVATLLETARALAAGPALRNDVIFLFTDGEELGLLGAAAFVAEHPWKSRVGVVLNLDNRGTRGPVVMYETGAGNLPLMREYARTVGAPRAASLAGAVARLMPNSSDFFVFRKAGLGGLNFAFIGGPENYHSSQDTPARLDLRTLQQAGDSALPLARRLGDLDLAALSGKDAPDAIYFNLGDHEVVYPAAWARPLGIAAIVLFLAVGALGVWRSRVRPAGILQALLLCAISLIAAWRIGDWLAMGLSRWAGSSGIPGAPGLYLFHPLYAIALGLLVAGLTLGVWELSGIGWKEAAVAGAIVWTMLCAALAYRLPAASYLAFWPLVFMLLAEGCLFAWRDCPPVAGVALLWIGAAPAVLMLASPLPSLYLALGMSTLGAAALAMLVALALWLLAPLLVPRGNARPRLALAGLAAGVALIAVGAWTVRYDDRHPRPEWMAYVLDADRSAAHWMSRTDGKETGSEIRLDPWRRQFLTNTPEIGELPVALGPRSSPLCWQHEAPRAEFAAPQATLLEETRQNQMRALRIRIASARRAERISITAKAALIGHIRLNGHDVDTSLGGSKGRGSSRASVRLAGERDSWSVLYAGAGADGLELTLLVSAGDPLELTLADVSDGLPEIPGHAYFPRPADVTEQHFADVTVVLKKFVF